MTTTRSWQYPTRGGQPAGEYQPGVPRFVRDPSSRMLLCDHIERRTRDDGNREIVGERVEWWRDGDDVCWRGGVGARGSNGTTYTVPLRCGDRVAVGIVRRQYAPSGGKTRTKHYVIGECKCGSRSAMETSHWRRATQPRCAACGKTPWRGIDAASAKERKARGSDHLGRWAVRQVDKARAARERKGKK